MLRLDPGDPRLLSEKELRRQGSPLCTSWLSSGTVGESSTVPPNWLQVGINMGYPFRVAWVQAFPIYTTPNITSSSQLSFTLIQLSLGCNVGTKLGTRGWLCVCSNCSVDSAAE